MKLLVLAIALLIVFGFPFLPILGINLLLSEAGVLNQIAYSFASWCGSLILLVVAVTCSHIKVEKR